MKERKIGQQLVERMAFLARMEIKKEQAAKIQNDLAEILDYINMIEEVDVFGVEPTGSGSQSGNVLRKDEIKESSEIIKEKMLSQAPEKEKKFFKVKEILK